MESQKWQREKMQLLGEGACWPGSRGGAALISQPGAEGKRGRGEGANDSSDKRISLQKKPFSVYVKATGRGRGPYFGKTVSPGVRRAGLSDNSRSSWAQKEEAYEKNARSSLNR